MRARVIPGGIALILAGCGLSVLGSPSDDAGVVDAAGQDASAPDADLVAETSTPPIDVDAGVPDAPIDSGPPPCVGTALECCGGSACPTGTTECLDGGCYVTITIAARIDGRDDLLLKGDTARWQHIQHNAPSALKLNGQTWNPSFPGNNMPNNFCKDCFSSTTKPLAPPVAAHAQNGILGAWTGRGGVSIGPATMENGYTLAVQFSDPMNNEDDYTASVKYETR